MILKNIFIKIRGTFKLKCEFCKKSISRKSAYFEKVKRLEFVHPVNTSFCNGKCCNNYKTYEESVPRRLSLCSSCPVHPDAV